MNWKSSIGKSPRVLQVVVFLVLAGPVMLCMAAMGPIDSITADNPTGSPPYNLTSVTIGGYTVGADQLATGTTTFGSIGGTAAPENDDFDINTALNYNLGQSPWFTVNFGGGLWKNSNGDNPDFIIFDSGGNGGDTPVFQAIFPDGSLGQPVSMPGAWGMTGYIRVFAATQDAVNMDGQQYGGKAFSITDLLDASGNPLTEDAVILGLSFARGGTDPVGLFAVVPPPVLAANPMPENGAEDVIREAVLSWEPGQTAVSHNVYFGTSLDDVSNADLTNSLGVQVGKGLDVNEFAPETRLDFGETYYWRVDEVSGPPDNTVIKGDVWRFTAEPYSVLVPGSTIGVTASSVSFDVSMPEKTIDGSGLEGDTHSANQEDMWLSAAVDLNPWLLYEFDATQKIDQMLIWNSNSLSEAFIGWGIKDVNIEYSMDGVDWTALSDTTQINRAPGLPTYDSPQAIDFGLIQAKYVRLNILSNWGGLLKQYSVSEVQFYALPVQAREPKPASGSVDVLPNATVTWRAGRQAGQHTLYASTDPNALAEGSARSVTSMTSSVDLGLLDLQLDETYYWRVDEVNEAEVPSVWAGPVWSLRTPVALIVDNFESYGNISPNRPFQTWLDGFGYSADEFFPVEYAGNGTGAGVGHDIWSPGSPYFEGQIMETETTLPGSGQSLPFYFSNPGGAGSQIDRKWTVPQNWTLGGAKTLVLYFFGNPENTGQLYVQVNNGNKVVYNGSAAAISTPYWTQWNIDLASLGVNLQSVTQLSIGAQGGSGMVYIDDIQLYKEAPAAPGEQLWLEAESATLTGPMQEFTDMTDATGGAYISTENLGNVGAHTDGVASYTFTVEGGTYGISGRVIEPAGGGSNSFWVRLQGATMNTTPSPDNDGWINWNFTVGTTWHWDQVINTDDGNIPIQFALAQGTYTLEIAYREDGAKLDAIVITDQL